MPGHEHTYTYRHLLRFGQTMVVSALILCVPLLVSLLRGARIDVSILSDGLLLTTVVIYCITYRHTFTGSLYLSSQGLFVNRLLLARQELYWQDIRRVTVQELPAGYPVLLAGPRLRMIVEGEEQLEIEISDLEHSDQFLLLVGRLTECHGIPMHWQGENGSCLLDGGAETKQLTA